MAEKCSEGGGGFGRPRRALTALALSLLTAGCYAYTEVSPAALSNGDPLTPLRGLRGTVSVPVADVERLEVRRLQKGFTAAAVTTGALLGFAVLEWAFNVTNPNKEGGDEPGGVDQARVVLFGLRW